MCTCTWSYSSASVPSVPGAFAYLTRARVRVCVCRPPFKQLRQRLLHRVHVRAGQRHGAALAAAVQLHRRPVPAGPLVPRWVPRAARLPTRHLLRHPGRDPTRTLLFVHPGVRVPAVRQCGAATAVPARPLLRGRGGERRRGTVPGRQLLPARRTPANGVPTRVLRADAGQRQLQRLPRQRRVPGRRRGGPAVHPGVVLPRGQRERLAAAVPAGSLLQLHGPARRGRVRRVPGGRVLRARGVSGAVRAVRAGARVRRGRVNARAH